MRIERLSKNFHFLEMVKTDHDDLYKSNINCARHPALVRNLQALCQQILQPIRDYYDSKIIITSGYRCPDLNRRLNGAENSQHMYGEAADFYISGVRNEDIFMWVIHSSNIVYGQIILEPSWIHISFPKMYKSFYGALTTYSEDGAIKYKNYEK